MTMETRIEEAVVLLQLLHKLADSKSVKKNLKRSVISAQNALRASEQCEAMSIPKPKVVKKKPPNLRTASYGRF